MFPGTEKKVQPPHKTDRPQQKLFDQKLIKNCIYKLIPEGFPQERLENGVFVIKSHWKSGDLKRIDIDKQNITDKIDKLTAETAFETLLTNSKRFRYNFSGKIDLTITVKDKELESLYWEPGNFIINKPFQNHKKN